MQQSTSTSRRRAAPPRPSLLVGDLSGCRAAFDALQEEVLRLQLGGSASLAAAGRGDAAAWERLVPRCRAIRETLTSEHELSDFTRQVYECSADICLRAGDLGEALKCLRQLVELIYAALAAAQLPRAAQLGISSQSSLRSGVAPPPGLQLAPPVAASGADRAQQQQQQQQGDPQAGAAAGAGLGALLTKPAFARWPEMAAALLLYYKCHQATAGEGLDTVITLRRLPPALLAREEVQRSLRLAAALDAGDFVAFFRALAGAPRTVQVLVQGRLAQVRQQALASMAAAYRNIDTAAAARMLGLDDSRALLAALKALADRGHCAAQAALNSAQTSDTAAVLVFR